jgi:homoserine dehydrogenase
VGSDVTRVALFGLGSVGRALLELLEERSLPVELVGAADSRGGIAGALDPSKVLEMKKRGPLPGDVLGTQLLEASRPDVVIDVMSCDFASGEPSLGIMLDAIGRGVHVATANKAPLARYWTKLWEAADASGASIGYSGAAGAALPAVAVARSLARLDRIDSFEGVLTGTTTFVLDEMSAGTSFADAVRAAQDAGIAEPDPSIDVGGWDTAAKVVILANTLWEGSLTLDDVNVTGLDEASIANAKRKLRLVGEAIRTDHGVELKVEPRPIDPSHPLDVLKERDKGIVFRGPAIGDVVVAGGRSHPRGAAASVLGDVLELAGRSRG